jgi:hypothetical protein
MSEEIHRDLCQKTSFATCDENTRILVKPLPARQSFPFVSETVAFSRYLETSELTDADRALNVLSDQIVEIGRQKKEEARPDHKIRLLEVQTRPHTLPSSRPGTRLRKKI